MFSKKLFLKYASKFIGKDLSQGLFLINNVAGYKGETLLKRDSVTRVLLRILLNSLEHYFYEKNERLRTIASATIYFKDI